MRCEFYRTPSARTIRGCGATFFRFFPTKPFIRVDFFLLVVFVSLWYSMFASRWVANVLTSELTSINIRCVFFAASRCCCCILARNLFSNAFLNRLVLCAEHTFIRVISSLIFFRYSRALYLRAYSPSIFIKDEGEKRKLQTVGKSAWKKHSKATTFT